MPVRAPIRLAKHQASYLTMEQITREAIVLFRNGNAFMKHIDQEYRFSQAYEFRIGSNLRVRLPSHII